MKFNVKKVEFSRNIKLQNIIEYEFSLTELKATLQNDDKIDIYLRKIKNNKIKESTYCYWSLIYDEELKRIREKEKNELERVLNKVLISENMKQKYQQSIFLEIENNKSEILNTGTEVHFIDIVKYLERHEKTNEKLNGWLEYFEKENEDVLLIGIKLNQD